MNPYALDQQNYIDALGKFQRQASQFNAKAKTFNNSLYKDGSGGQAGMVSGQWTGNTPSDLTGYGLYTAKDGNQLLVKPQSVQDAGTATMNYGGRGTRWLTLPSGERISYGNDTSVAQRALLQRGYVGTAVPSFANGAQIALQRGTYAQDPGTFTQAAPTAPEATVSQSHGQTAADVISAGQRGGLISDVLASRGVR